MTTKPGGAGIGFQHVDDGSSEGMDVAFKAFAEGVGQVATQMVHAIDEVRRLEQRLGAKDKEAEALTIEVARLVSENASLRSRLDAVQHFLGGPVVRSEAPTSVVDVDEP